MGRDRETGQDATAVLKEQVNTTLAVSVILPTYNRAYCIRRSIDSVLNQTFRNFELIIIDDGSKDDTQQIVEWYDDPRIVFIHNKSNAGQTKRLKTACRSPGPISSLSRTATMNGCQRSWSVR